MRIRPASVSLAALLLVVAACILDVLLVAAASPSVASASAAPVELAFAGGTAGRRQGPAGAGGDARATGGDGGSGRRPGSLRGGEDRAGRRDPRRGGRPDPVLDLTGQVSSGSEQGLLGIVFSPDGRLPVREPHRHERQHQRPELLHGRARGRCGLATRGPDVDQPFSNHNGGDLVVRPRRLPLHRPRRRRQRGRSERQRPVAHDAARQDAAHRADDRRATVPYTIPPDNPFVGQAERPARDLGLRAAQPVAVLVRPRDRRPVDRRRRARTRGRRSTGSRPARRAGRTTGGTGWRARTRTRAMRRPARCRRSTSIPTPAAAARSPAATSTGARRSPASSARTCSRTSASGRIEAIRVRDGQRGRSGRPRPVRRVGRARSDRTTPASSTCCRSPAGVYRLAPG